MNKTPHPKEMSRKMEELHLKYLNDLIFGEDCGLGLRGDGGPCREHRIGLGCSSS